MWEHFYPDIAKLLGLWDGDRAWSESHLLEVASACESMFDSKGKQVALCRWYGVWDRFEADKIGLRIIALPMLCVLIYYGSKMEWSSEISGFLAYALSLVASESATANAMVADATQCRTVKERKIYK